jgi:hypothetical protein
MTKVVVPNQIKYDNDYEGYYEEGEVSEFDLSECPDLEELHCSGLQLNHLDVSKCPKLRILYCGYNKLTELDLSQCTKLEKIKCDGNILMKLDVSSCSELISLECEHNNITTLIISNFNNLYQIICYKNEITVLEVSNCPKLDAILCNDNKLTTLIIENCPKLTYLECQTNHLDNLPELPNSLNYLNCSDNPFSNFILPNNFSKLSPKVRKELSKFISFKEKENYFFKQEYIDVFRGFDFGDLKDKFDKIITQSEFKENNINFDSFKLTNCKGGINPNYFQASIINLFNQSDFDGVCCLKNDEIVGFCIVDKGECLNYPHFYPINLICSEGIARILLCFYIYCCNRNKYPIGLLELAGSITNKAGYVAYTKVGFYYDYKDTKLNCFDLKNNLQMKVLTNKLDENFFDILSGKKKYTNQFIAEESNKSYFNKKLDKIFEKIRKNAETKEVKQLQKKTITYDIIDEYHSTLEKMQNLYIVDTKVGGRRTKKTKKRVINTKKRLVK